MAFLKREYTWVAVFVAAMAVLIFILLDYGRPWGAVAYASGAVLSASAGLIGMRIATAANSRTAEAAREGGIRKALPLAFRGGAVMGFSVRDYHVYVPMDCTAQKDEKEVLQAFSLFTSFGYRHNVTMTRSDMIQPIPRRILP